MPKRGEQVCGDAIAYGKSGEKLFIYVIDALGHGPSAAEAARTTLEFIEKHPSDDSPSSILERIHDVLHGSRGAAISIAKLDTGNPL